MILLVRDLLDGFREKELWWHFAKQDILLRYRRSVIGPFWITISNIVFCLCLGVVYSRLFNMKLDEYLPFVSSGFIFWATFSGMLNEATNLLISNGQYICHVKTNFFSVMLRFVARHGIVLVHNIPIFIGMILYFDLGFGWVLLWLLPGIMLVTANMLMLVILISIIGLRYRDFNPIVQCATQVAFFITPIMWFPRLVGEDSLITLLNPFNHFLDLLRSPILGQAPAAIAWFFSILFLLIITILATILYQRKIHRIPYWL